MPPPRTDRESEPPELPVLKRRLSFAWWQVVGIAVLALVPLLAGLGVFGAAEASVVARAGSVSMLVDYPPRIRHGSAQRILALVTNTGLSALDTVTVRFDSSYVARVSEPQFTPLAARAFEVDLADLRPGESRRVELAFHAADFGRHRGFVSARHGASTARAIIATTVFP